MYTQQQGQNIYDLNKSIQNLKRIQQTEYL